MRKVYFGYVNKGNIIFIHYFPSKNIYEVSISKGLGEETETRLVSSPKEAFEFGGFETLLEEEETLDEFIESLEAFYGY